MSDSLRFHGLQPARLFCPWDSPGKNTGVGCHALLQGVFLSSIEHASLTPPALAGRFFTTSTTWEDIRWGQASLNTLSHFFAKNFTFWLPQALVAACKVFITICELLIVANGIQLPNQESNLGPLPWECRVLATGPQWTHNTLSSFWDGERGFQFSSVTQSCPTLCNPVDCSTQGFPVHHQLPELAQTHIHWVGDAIQPSHPLSTPSPPNFNLSQHQGLFNESVLHIRWPKYWSFSFNISPSNEHSGLISFRMDWLDLLAM